MRAITPEDAADWRGLWAGYCAFYETQVSASVTARTFARMIDPAAPLFGRVAELNGRVVGFSISILHDGTWVEAPICYLEDLFVAPEARGQGVGRALIDDLLELGRAAGWSRLYGTRGRTIPRAGSTTCSRRRTISCGTSFGCRAG